MKKNINNIIKRVRTNILKLTFQAKSAHIGSCLSIVEILVTLYQYVVKKNDRFILSKGHSALALYCVLYSRRGLCRSHIPCRSLPCCACRSEF